MSKRNEVRRLQGIASRPEYVIIAQNYSTLVTYLENIVGVICAPDATPPRKQSLSLLVLAYVNAQAIERTSTL